MNKDTANKNIEKSNYLKILILIFLISSVIAITGSIYQQHLGDEYVFRSSIIVIHTFCWILAVGLAIMIPLTYLNSGLGLTIVPFIVIAMFVLCGFTYKEEVRSGEYIIEEVQGLGEKMIFYYEDVNMFIMKRSHREIEW